MGKAVLLLLKKHKDTRYYDETDRVPADINITNFDLLLYLFGIIIYLVDLALDINVCVRYFLEGKTMEFCWTLAFLIVPLFVNTAVSIAMYSQDKWHKPDPNEDDGEAQTKWSKRHTLRVIMLTLQLTTILRIAEALIYALKSREAASAKDKNSQRRYYERMLNEDADLALLKIFECFLEAAPQQVLQTTLLFRGYHSDGSLRVHQILSICSSVLSMGWCLAAYQRAIRYVQEDKLNMSWMGSGLQTLWHFLVTLSRVISLSTVAYLYPVWTILGCCLHIFTMFAWVQIFDRSPFCSHTRLGEIAFSLALGSIYLFTYILPKDGKTRYRYLIFYSVCFIENVVCASVWWAYSDIMLDTFYFHVVAVLCVVPYLFGLLCMILYYSFLHPKLRYHS